MRRNFDSGLSKRSTSSASKSIFTGKATRACENGPVMFEVDINANKPNIKKAVEELFGIKVKAVDTVVTKGKTKRFRGIAGKRKDVKKVYVTLEDGDRSGKITNEGSSNFHPLTEWTKTNKASSFLVRSRVNDLFQEIDADIAESFDAEILEGAERRQAKASEALERFDQLLEARHGKT